MPSGVGNTREWVLVGEPSRKEIDPLMGQVRLSFASKDKAIAHVQRQGWRYTLNEPKGRAVRPKAYTDNFAFTRVGRWTY